jgi:hypothetical protein
MVRRSQSQGVLRVLRTRLWGVAIGTALLLPLQSCYTWVPQPSGTRLIAERRPSLVRVTLQDSRTRELYDPWIAGDSLLGFSTPSLRVPWEGVRLAEVRQVEVQQSNAGGVVLAVVAIGVTIALIAAAAGGGTKAPPSSPPPGPITFSCPLVYSWDGTRWRLDSGTFGGAITRGLQRTDVDNLDFAAPRDGVLRLRVTNELAETDYVDALGVIAVDHDSGAAVAPDPMGRLHTLGTLTAPVTAADFRGRDALDRVREADGWNWESVPTGLDTARSADLRDGLQLAFVRPTGATRAHLVLDANSTPWSAYLLGQYVSAHGAATQAWYDSLDADPRFAQGVATRLAREAFLSASVRAGDRWVPQGLFWEAGPEVVKRQVLELDLRGVTGDTVRVRLESVPSFWLVDRVALDFSDDAAMTAQPLTLTSARFADGRDVRALLDTLDGRYLTLETGDAAELAFAAPPVPAGRARSYLLRSTGWYRVHTRDDGPADITLLTALATAPNGLSRIAVAKLNEAVASMTGGNR